jgi:geranyl-CoA carboxylase alpha subunit
LAQHEESLTTLRPYQAQAIDFAVAGLLLSLATTPTERLQTASLPPKHITVSIGEAKQDVQVAAPLTVNSAWQITVGADSFALSIYSNKHGKLTYVLNGHRRALDYVLDDGSVYFDMGQGQIVAADDTYAPPKTANAASQNQINAPMDGLLVNVLTQVGDTVSAGQTLLLLEAMKIEHPLKAPCAGVVKEIIVTEKQQVKKRQLLLVIEPSKD